MSGRVLVLALLSALALLAVPSAPAPAQEEAELRELRETMVERQLQARDIEDTLVLQAMRKVPRHEFVPEELRAHAYADRPLPIGEGQTISQPYIVALMTQHARVRPGDRVLEIGTGSGYQAAVLAEIGARVHTIEIVGELARTAEERLDGLGYEDVEVRHGDGYEGWPGRAPFDAIVVTAAPEEMPRALVEQLAPGGRLVVPVGAQGSSQSLQVISKSADGEVSASDVLPVRFVPFTRDE